MDVPSAAGESAKGRRNCGALAGHNLRFKTSDQRGRRLQALRRFQSQHDEKEIAAWLQKRAIFPADQWLGRERQRHVERLTHLQTEELSRRDADDCERHPFDDQRLADRVRVTRQPTLPERVADHDDRAIHPAAAQIVRSREHPPVLRRNAERLEETSADEQPVDDVGLRALAERHRSARSTPASHQTGRAAPAASPTSGNSTRRLTEIHG